MIKNSIFSLKEYKFQIGVLICEMILVRQKTFYLTKNLSIKQLDFNLDGKSNSIGTLLLHIAALEIKFQYNHFNKKITDFELDILYRASPYNMSKRLICENNLDYYTQILKEARISTKKELKKVNDEWLLEEVNTSDGALIGNNHYLLRHIINDEISHQGQIKMILKRLKKCQKLT